MLGHLWQFGNRKNPISAHAPNVLHYKNILKHSLIFHRKVIFADHMIANSPNFLRCLADGTIDDLVTPESTAVAHIEPVRDYHEVNKNTRTFTGLRQFYRHYGYFDGAIPRKYCTEAFDDVLARVEPRFGKVYAENPDPYAREKRFAGNLQRFMESDAYAKLFPEATPTATILETQAQLRLAIRIIEERHGPIGIIHVDQSQVDEAEGTVYDVIRSIPGVQEDLSHPIHYGDWQRRLTRICRSLLFKAEIGDLLLSPILTPMEHEHIELFMERSAQACKRDEAEQVIELPVQCGCLKNSGLTMMSGEDIRVLRASASAERFYAACDELLGSKTPDAHAAREALTDYIGFIDKYVYDKYRALRDGKSSRTRSRLLLTVSKLTKRAEHTVEGSFVLRLVTPVATTLLLGRLRPLVERIAAETAKLRGVEQDIRAAKLVHRHQDLTMYSRIGRVRFQ